MSKRRKKSSGCGYLIGLFLIILVMIAAILIFLVPHSNSEGEIGKSDSEFRSTVDEDDEKEDDDSAVESASFDMESLYDRYAQLNDEEQQIYCALLDQLNDRKTSCTIKGTDAETYEASVNNAVYALYFDHPEFFWIDGGYSYTRTITGRMKIELHCYDYWKYSMNRKKYQTALDERVNEIVELASQQETDYDKVKFVHDYLVQTVTYDHDTYENDISGQSLVTKLDASYEYAHSAYGCLVNNLCVCDGYAKAFQLVMQKIGISCYYTEGNADNGEVNMAHAWNFLQLDGDYYYVDVTWDDMNKEDYPEFVRYEYFDITYDELMRDHSYPDNEKYNWAPKTDAIDYNYYYHEDYYLTSYHFDEVSDILERQLQENPDIPFASIRFSSAREALKAKTALIDNANIWEINCIAELGSDRKMSYIAADDSCYIYFLFSD